MDNRGECSDVSYGPGMKQTRSSMTDPDDVTDLDEHRRRKIREETELITFGARHKMGSFEDLHDQDL